MAVLRAEIDCWTGMDDGAGEGIAHEDIGRYRCFLAEIQVFDLAKLAEDASRLLSRPILCRLRHGGELGVAIV